jgi:uncharacterized membrane protein YedE/YeeE
MRLQKSTLRGASSLLAGVVFGVGLTVAQMTNPAKVLDFLDVTGAWDASLLFVLGGAVLLSAAVFRWVLRKPAPVLDANFYLPTSTVIDARLLTGAAIFGIGWGIAGYCPGPAVASLGLGNPEALWVLPSLLAGLAVQRWIDKLDHPAGRTSQTH